MKILVSSCLMGLNCRYDGRDNFNQELYNLIKNQDIIVACPEVLGGLDIPRIPCEIKENKVINKLGHDYSQAFELGAFKALEYYLDNKCDFAILKAKSPSCGNEFIYDGNFNHTLIEGQGVCAKLFISNNIQVFNENQIKQIKKTIEK